MDIETITKLLDAGYTKAEIDAMQAGHDAGNEANKGAGEENQNASEEQSAPNTENAGALNQPVEIGAAIEALTNTVAGLKETVKAMQDKNAAGASTEKAKTTTVDEVMKSFIDSL